MRAIAILFVVLALIGCENRRADYGHVSGVISMKDVPQGWGSTSVPEGHPQVLIDPDGNLLVRNNQVDAFFNYHGSMKWKADPKWELKPSDLHGGRFHRLVNTEKEEGEKLLVKPKEVREEVEKD